MKKVLLSLVAMMVATTSFAQNTVVASLSHGTETTIFYGSNALKDAVAAAESGDVINLSAGTFYASDISKGITLRGTGIDIDEPTYIVNDFVIEIPAEDTKRFIMEGIRCQNWVRTKGSFDNPSFVKCQFNVVGNATESDAVKNILFTNCKITGGINVGGDNSVFFINSFVAYISKYQNGTIMSKNSIHRQPILSSLTQSIWSNCIFYPDKYSEHCLPADAQVTNCVAIGYAYDMFRGMIEHPNCKQFGNYQDVFKEYNGGYTDEQTFELNDEAKTTLLGTDGKEVGLYGGPLPFDLTLSYPIISKMEVGEQTDDKGQLKVEIGVK